MISLRFVILILCVFLAACVSKPPRDVNNICNVFKQHPHWKKDARDVQYRWRIPVSVQMAIIHQESKFDGRARPRHRKVVWFIPGKRRSSAYGYAQALDSTWALYKKSHGSLWASRDNFAAGVDFIGWYANQAYKRAGIARTDAYNLYLAYHEGVSGYMHKSYLKKPWLVQVAKKVKLRADIYQSQLARCS